MSTRSTTHFVHGERREAIVYRHSDGYPDGAGRDLIAFFEDVKAHAKDTRFTDASYLAAKYVVWLADKFATTYDPKTNTFKPSHPLDFISVGVVMADPGDIEWRYVVDCDVQLPNRPSVHVFEGYGNTWTDKGELADVLAALP